MSEIPEDVLDNYPHAADLVDDFSDSEFESSSLAAASSSGSVSDRCVVVMGLPVVAVDKTAKLHQFLKTLLDKVMVIPL
jgi:hypothetical protein